MKNNYTFIHGWGMDRGVWGNMAQHFLFEQSEFVDLGFFNPPHCEGATSTKKSIYITHSLGAIWALKHCLENIEALIIINGFSKFTDFVDKRTLIIMQKQLRRNPKDLMQGFWGNIGFKQPLDNLTLDVDRLHEGLGWLINWSASAELARLNAPVLVLHGGKDPLLSNKVMAKHFVNANIKTHENSGHLLPLTHANWCAKEIKEFIRGIGLEK